MPELEYAAVYRETRERLSDFARDLDGASVTPAPSCPGWTVQDVCSHLVGIIADIQAGRMDGVGSDAWTLAQVTARRDRTIGDVIDEWAAIAPAFEEQVAGWPGAVAGQLVSDCSMHELDVRNAVGDTGARDTDGVRIAMSHYANGFAERVVAAGLGPIALDVGDEIVVVGDGEPAVSVAATRFEISRALSGRRSADQIQGYAWERDASTSVEAYVALFGAHGNREEALVE